MSTVLAASHRSTLALARDVLSLFKLRIGLLIMVTALVGYVVTPGHASSALQVLVLALSTLGAASAAGAFNQYYERDGDRLMARTRERAFVTGALPHHPAWLVLIVALLTGSVASAWWVVNPSAALFVFLGAFFYGVVYTVWLKRRTWLNIVVGGLAGSFAVLAGAAAADPQFGTLPWLFALILFLWTPPHFWSLAIANQSEYAAAGVPMLPVVVGSERAARIVRTSTLALVIASMVPVFFGSGIVYLIGAAAGGVYFLSKAQRLAAAPSRTTAIDCFLASLIHLSTVLAAACLDVALR